MEDIKVKVNFKQLLEDIDYTNKVKKTYDVTDIITKGQYYNLKDNLIVWLMKHEFTETKVNGYDYTIGKDGKKVYLVKLIITYDGVEYKVHQNLDRKMRDLLCIGDRAVWADRYVPEVHSVEYDETRFRESLSRMKVNCLRFKRNSFENDNCFWSMIGDNPWMRAYLGFLPNKGNAYIKIVEDRSEIVSIEKKKEIWKKDLENWINEACTYIKSPEDLMEFSKKLVEHCSSLEADNYYEQSCDATKAIVLAAMQMCKKIYGLSVFQTGCIMWDFIDHTVIEQHDVGMELVNYNNMLYPQYDYRFEKTITKETWNELKKKAKKLLEENEKPNAFFHANEEVVEHWKSIVNGKVPFGYKVK